MCLAYLNNIFKRHSVCTKRGKHKTPGDLYAVLDHLPPAACVNNRNFDLGQWFVQGLGCPVASYYFSRLFLSVHLSQNNSQNKIKVSD